MLLGSNVGVVFWVTLIMGVHIFRFLHLMKIFEFITSNFFRILGIALKRIVMSDAKD